MITKFVTAETQAFLQHCENARNLSTNTLDAYQQDLTCFTRFLKTKQEQDSISNELVLRYLEYFRHERTHRQATIRRRMVTLRAFSTWLKKKGAIDNAPFDDLELDLTPPRRLPRPVERVDVKTMLKMQTGAIGIAAATPPYPNERHATSRITTLAIKLMVSTGVRVGELTRIKLSNISNDGYRIRIFGKGSRERNVYIGNIDLRAELLNIKWQALEAPHEGDYLLLNCHHHRLTEQALRRRLRLLAEKCKLDTRITPHRFRHSAATFLIEEGVDIRFVQRLLGHSSIATTEIYMSIGTEHSPLRPAADLATR